MEHFIKNLDTVAIPVGVSALDENTIRCKSLTSDRSFIKSMPVEFGKGYYFFVVLEALYLHTMWNNNSGNKSGIPPPVTYCAVLAYFAMFS